MAAKVVYSRKVAAPVELKCVGAEVEEDEGKDSVIDLNRPLEGDCTLELIMFDSSEGKQVFWHSSAHVLGQALEQLYGTLLTHGPALEKGFFYDGFMGKASLSQHNY